MTNMDKLDLILYEMEKLCADIQTLIHAIKLENGDYNEVQNN